MSNFCYFQIHEFQHCLNEDRIEFEMMLSKFSLLVIEMAEAVAKQVKIKALEQAEADKKEEKGNDKN